MGRIWADDNPDGGARFCFTIPVYVGDDDDPDWPVVLVVEDEPAPLRMIEASLKARHYRVVTAATGARSGVGCHQRARCHGR